MVDGLGVVEEYQDQEDVLGDHKGHLHTCESYM